ncbi:hypothetical protein F3J37_01675 [Pantoea sp. Al-1710]|uniref:Uncharacterized protein n=1 Tax=Candidatus Pantoea communis TaxID=2608354 RepID=A0ABX0RLN9_9GAMM|nr:MULTISPECIES: type III secretion system chaperone [Pantoea]NIG12911.1 hypothetical protein [Pantoea sp. Cy-640]NIG17388.1 hypothetical protein [Pantoea communis]
MKPEEFYKKLQPLFNQLHIPDIPLNEQGYYTFMLETGQVFLELTEVDTMVMLAFLPLPEKLTTDLLLELLQANLTPDQPSRVILAADKEDKRLCLWIDISTDKIYHEELYQMLEQLNVTMRIISRWFEETEKEKENGQQANQRNIEKSRQAEAMLNKRRR